MFKKSMFTVVLSLLLVGLFAATALGATFTYDFNDQSQLEDFDFYKTTGEGFVWKDGKLSTGAGDSESKAILKGAESTKGTVEVDIIPETEDTKINVAVYIGAGNAGDAQDAVDGLGVIIESNLVGWDDAPNRIDLLYGKFRPGWTELYREISETGKGNNLYTDGKKQPLHLKIEYDGNKVNTTVSLLNDPSKSFSKEIELAEPINGTIGLRSQYCANVYFDNLKIENNAASAGSETPAENPDTFDGGIALYAMLLAGSAAGLVLRKRVK